MRRISVVLSMAAIFFFLAYGSVVSAQDKKPIVIGFIHAMSGPMSMYGISSEAGGRIALDEINAAGGVLGRPLKMITRDDKLNPEVGLREAKDLILSEKADVITGTISAAVATAISNYAKREKKLYIVTISTSSMLTEENFHRYVFRISTNSAPYAGMGPALATLKKFPDDKKMVAMGFDYEFGRISLKLYKEAMKSKAPDIQFVDELWVPTSATDFTPFITKMANSGAQAFYSSLFGGAELAFTKQAWAFGLFDKMHAVMPCAGDVETWCNVTKGEPYPKGALAGCRFPFWELPDPRVKAFVETHKKKVGFVPSYGAADQYITMYALKAAIEKAGVVDTEKIIDALEGMQLDTFLGKFPIRAFDHQAMLPTWYGTIDFTADLPFPHITKTHKVGEDSYHTIEQIKKIRAGR